MQRVPKVSLMAVKVLVATGKRCARATQFRDAFGKATLPQCGIFFTAADKRSFAYDLNGYIVTFTYF
jgi:hypothetical protein